MKTGFSMIKVLAVISGLLLWLSPCWAETEYVVKSGDTLWKIAKKFYNDPYRWSERQTDYGEPVFIFPADFFRKISRKKKALSENLRQSFFA